MQQSAFGLIGLGIMGQNLACNVAEKGIRTSVYNRTTQITDAFIAKHENKLLVGHHSIKDFVQSLASPKKIFLMVQAGPAVDAIIEQLLPHLKKGDIIIDGGNSHYRDTQQREATLKKKGVLFVGCGVSGGEEGALNGPSLMPGGSLQAWRSIQKILTAIAAKDFHGQPCVAHLGANGAGHYVKMVHNGIEYAIMQMIAEVYSIYRDVYQLQAPKIATRFATMNKGSLKSFLFDATATVLNKKDDAKKHGFLIDAIADVAGSKGTGKWTSVDALDRGVATPSIAEAVFARSLSSRSEDRKALERIYHPRTKRVMSLQTFDTQIRKALYAGVLLAYVQGLDLIHTAAEEEKWAIDLATVTRTWQGGCIIRADMLTILHTALQKRSDTHILQCPAIHAALIPHLPALRRSVATLAETSMPIPALSSALSYVDSMTHARGSANMIQALRDLFGAHTYERIDTKGTFHSHW